MSDDNKDWRGDLPFPKRWIAYGIIKLVILALAVWLVLGWYGLI